MKTTLNIYNNCTKIYEICCFTQLYIKKDHSLSSMLMKIFYGHLLIKLRYDIY